MNKRFSLRSIVLAQYAVLYPFSHIAKEFAATRGDAKEHLDKCAKHIKSFVDSRLLEIFKKHVKNFIHSEKAETLFRETMLREFCQNNNLPSLF